MNARCLGGVLTFLAAAWPAAAQPTGNPAAGQKLAAQLCTACHIIGTERVGSDAAPPFAAIAKDPAKSLTQLHGWSGPMHPVLSNLALTARQIADINAYLDSLRAAGDQEPSRVGTEEPPPALEVAPPEKLGEPIEVRPE